MNNFSKDDKQRPVYITESHSLGETLMEQLRFRSLSEEELIVAAYIVGSLDDDGYLRRDLQSVSDDIAFSVGLDLSVEELERVLRVIQELEPSGVGARNLQECLLLQLRSMEPLGESQQLAHKILSDYFDDFAKKHYDRLLARLGVDRCECDDAREQNRLLSH